jgi:hypothetical protein
MCIPVPLTCNGSVKHYCGNEYTDNNRIIVGRVVLKVGNEFFPEPLVDTISLRVPIAPVRELQPLMFAIPQGSVRHPGVFLRKTLSADILDNFTRIIFFNGYYYVCY